MKKTLGIISAAFCASALSSQAAVLVDYQFNDPADYNIISGTASSARVTWNATITAADTSASIFQGDGLQLFANGGLNTAFTSTAGSAAEGADAGDSMTFTLSAGSGYTLDLTNLTFDLTANQGATAYHVDAYADGSLTAVELLASTTADGPFDLDLTGFASDVESIEFRINMDVFNSGNMQIDNVIVNGDVVAVPEPSSASLLGLGGLALILRRRK
ncbi:PEP-CTERM sorting domain-containing protein [Rubritalea sp.]|uniref:PEP-CTERM sorting domain-containing protein n=1 Tax=Rubritalea sp. TaxID=2109375 RepID=UPI003EF2EC1F